MAAKKAGMATGVQVARISVKVSPDTKMFRKELKKKLEALEKNLAYKAKVSVDTKAATAEAKKAAEAMSKNKVKFSIDSKALDTDVEKMRKKMDLLDLKWDKKVKDFRRGGAFEKVSAPKFEFAQMRSESNRIIQDYEQQLDRVQRANKTFDVSIDAVVSEKSKWHAAQEIKAAVAKAFGGSGSKGGKGGSKSGFDLPSLPDLPKGGKSDFPSFGSGINPAGWAVILTGITAAAGPLVGIISTALAAMPGLISMLLAPITAVTLGLDGFKKAAQSIKPEFDALKTTMSQVAESSFTPVMKRVADEIFPKLKESLPSVTKGLADMSNSVVDGLSGPRMSESIERIGAAFSAIDLSGFTSGLTGMVDQFTQKLPGIVDWINQAGAGFDQWVQKVSADGSLQSAFGGLGEIIEKIASTVANLAKQGIEFLSKPENIQMTKDLLDGIAATLSTIMTVSSAIADTWDKVFHGGKLEDPSAQTKASRGSSRVLPSGKDFEEDPGKILGGGGEFGTPEKIKPPDTTEAKAAVEDYKTTTETSMQAAKTAVESATSGVKVTPPDLSGFEQSFDGLSKSADQAMQNVVSSVEQGGANAAAAATAAGNSIYQAMLAVVPLFQTVGLQMMAGLAVGIQAGSAGAITAAVSAATNALNAAKGALGIKSPSRKFMEIGGYASEGLAVGIENGIGPVIDQAKGLAAKVADAFARGADPSLNLDGYTNKEVSRMEKVLSFESKRLGMQAKALDYQAKTTGNDALKGKADEIRLQQDQINMQREMLDLTQEYADLQNPRSGSKSDNPFLASIQELMKIPDAFGGATMNQAMQDLGIGGNGALEAMGGYGAELLTKGVTNIFNTSNVDDTISLHNNQLNRQSQGIVGR